MDELVNRSTGEGMQNVLILVDAEHQLDSPDTAQRTRAIDEHKAWVDCAAQLGCDAIRVNCHSGGDRDENLENAARGRRREDTLEALNQLVPEYARHNTTDAAII